MEPAGRMKSNQLGEVSAPAPREQGLDVTCSHCHISNIWNGAGHVVSTQHVAVEWMNKYPAYQTCGLYTKMLNSEFRN